MNDVVFTCILINLQLPQFVEKLLESFTLLGEISYLPLPAAPMFSPSTELLFADHISNLPPGQSVEIIKLLVSHLTKLSNSVTKLETAAQLDPLLPQLERAADVLRLTLSHLTSGVYGGKLKDEALQLLQEACNCIVLPLITACTRLVSN